MELKAKDETALRNYLLGAASPEEQRELELWLMSDEDAYVLLEATEDQLIDESLGGRLQGRELNQFKNHFLAAPERQRKLQFGRSLRRAIDARTSTADLGGRRESSFWGRLLENVRFRPTLAFFVPVLIMLIVAGTGWSIFEIAELQRGLHSATADLVNIKRENDQLQQKLADSQSANQTLRLQLRTLEESITPKPSAAAPVLLALNLAPGLRRSSKNDLPKVMIAVNNKEARFSLTLLDDNYSTYSVVLRDADGHELWTREKIPSTTSREGKVVVVIVPTERLSNGDNSFGLMGIPNTGAPENIDRYYFRVVRQ
jgi:hypothetical protein